MSKINAPAVETGAFISKNKAFYLLDHFQLVSRVLHNGAVPIVGIAWMEHIAMLVAHVAVHIFDEEFLAEETPAIDGGVGGFAGIFRQVIDGELG